MNLIHLLVLLLHVHHMHAQNTNVLIMDKGALYISDQEWIIEYNFNLEAYFETTEILKDCIGKMKNFCSKHNNILCNYFIDVSEKFKNDVAKDTRKIIFLKREKRFVPLIIISVLGISVISGLTAFAATKLALGEVKNELITNYDLLEKSYEIAERSNNATLNAIAELENRVEEIRLNLTEKIDRNNFFQNAISVILFALRAHDHLHSKLLHFFLGDMKQKAYSLTDFDSLSNQIAQINANLSSELFLPDINSPSMLELLKFSSKTNNTDLVYKIHIPVLRRAQLNLFEIIPIPFMVNNDLMIINIEDTLLVREKTDIFSLSDFDSGKYCKSLPNFTICNSLILITMLRPKPCINDIFLYESDKSCFYSPIEKKIYLIKTSDNSLYINIFKPTTIKLLCDGNYQILNLTRNTEISFSKRCTTYLFTEKYHVKGAAKTVLQLDDARVYPRIEEYNFDTNLWESRNTIYERHSINVRNLNQELDTLKSKAQDHKISTQEIEAKPFSLMGFLGLDKVLRDTFATLGLFLVIALALCQFLKFTFLINNSLFFSNEEVLVRSFFTNDHQLYHSHKFTIRQHFGWVGVPTTKKYTLPEGIGTPDLQI